MSSAAAAKPRENFIPFRRADVVDMCADDQRMPAGDREGFRAFVRILCSVFHFEFHERLERLTDNYAPFDPDADTRQLTEPTSSELQRKQDCLVEELTEVLVAANYERVVRDDLEAAMAEESLFKVRLHVDFDDFDDVLFFRRGESARRETLREWFGLRKREIEFVNYDRVAIYVKFKDTVYFADRQRIDLRFVPGSTVIKLFQNVPKADLEMLFPNTEVRMKTIDKVLIGVPAAVGGIVVVATKLFATILLVGSLVAFWLGIREKSVAINQQQLVALAVGLGALGAFIFKQVNNFKNRKLKFMKALADNLYFKNLDNNAGVFHSLLHAAEEEECKEAILAFFFLSTTAEPCTEAELDAAIEGWFRSRWHCEMDFEVDDAVGKLERLGLIERDGEYLRAVPLAGAKERLDAIWDGYFQYNQPA